MKAPLRTKGRGTGANARGREGGRACRCSSRCRIREHEVLDIFRQPRLSAHELEDAPGVEVDDVRRLVLENALVLPGVPP